MPKRDEGGSEETDEVDKAPTENPKPADNLEANQMSLIDVQVDLFSRIYFPGRSLENPKLCCARKRIFLTFFMANDRRLLRSALKRR